MPKKYNTTPQPVKETPYINALLYSHSGVGKTSLAATAFDHPDMQQLLFLNFEGGLISVPSHIKDASVKIDVESMDHLEAVFWSLQNRDKGYEDVRTVIIDSGSEMQTLDLEIVVAKAFAKDQGDKGKKKREDRDTFFLEDYGKDTARLKRLFRWFRDAPYHVIITALTKKRYKKGATKDSEPTLIEVVPAFTDKLGESIRGYVDFCWYLYTQEATEDKEETRVLLTQDQGAYRAKTRGQAFAKEIGQVVENPNLATLFNTLLETEFNGKGKK